MACGTSDYAVRESCDQLRDEFDIRASYLRLRAYPFTDELLDFIRRHDRVYVVDQNRDAQLRSLLAIETGTPLEKMIPVLDYGGMPLTAGYVVNEILNQLRLLQHAVAPGGPTAALVGGAMRGVE